MPNKGILLVPMSKPPRVIFKYKRIAEGDWQIEARHSARCRRRLRRSAAGGATGLRLFRRRCAGGVEALRRRAGAGQVHVVARGRSPHSQERHGAAAALPAALTGICQAQWRKDPGSLPLSRGWPTGIHHSRNLGARRWARERMVALRLLTCGPQSGRTSALIIPHWCTPSESTATDGASVAAA
jgi:hypothetical protein